MAARRRATRETTEAEEALAVHALCTDDPLRPAPGDAILRHALEAAREAADQAQEDTEP